jgi:hypothetical protein
MKKKTLFEFDESGPRKVGRYYVSLNADFKHSQVKFDDDKWADANLYLPADYDLVWCKIENLKQKVSGWHTGTSWDGAKMQPEYKVLFWKMNYDT